MDDLFIHDALSIPRSELRCTFVRSSGPGGQNVNKVASKVILRWNPSMSRGLTESDRTYLLSQLANRINNSGDVVIASESERSQAQNRESAEKKLVHLVRTALMRPKQRVATRPSQAAKERRLAEKRRHALQKKRRSAPTEDE